MFSLIITIISVAVLAVLLSAGIGYIDTDGVVAKKNVMNIRSSIVNTGMSMTSYRNLMGIEAVNPAQLVPAFLDVKSLPSFLMLSSVGNEPFQGFPSNRFVCFDATISEDIHFLSIQALKDEFSDIIFISDCAQVSENVTLQDNTSTLSVKYYY